MTEYYEHIDSRYLKLLHFPIKHYKFRLDLMTHREETFAEITEDISQSSQGSITVNKSQGIRRSCSFTMININQKYTPSVNNPFWYNRKFRLYIGLCDDYNNSVYWFSQGVFVTKRATGNRHTVTIEAVDKFGFLDGTLHTQVCQLTTSIPAGTNVGKLIRDTLGLDLGNGVPTDPIFPIIDTELANKKTLNETVLNVGQYIGELFVQLATSFGADVYYDRMGRLHFSRIFNDDIPSWYVHKGATWDFDDTDINYIEPTVDYEFDGFNVVTVSSDNSDGHIYTYTAVNDNPQSPVAVSSVGYRSPDNFVVYIPLGEEMSNDTCRQYAEHLLLTYTCMTVKVNFATPLMPHFDVDETITITDSKYQFEQKKFLIQSLTIPFGVGQMTVGVVNLQWMPTGGVNFIEKK